MCSQRDGTEDISGCIGPGVSERNYCYDPTYDGSYSMDIKFPGAYSGTYTFMISTTDEGRIDSSALSL